MMEMCLRRKLWLLLFSFIARVRAGREGGQDKTGPSTVVIISGLPVTSPENEDENIQSRCLTSCSAAG